MNSEGAQRRVFLIVHPFLLPPGLKFLLGYPAGTSRKELACQCRRCNRHKFQPWVRKILSRRKQQLTPVFLPRVFHGQRILAGYGPWGLKELDTTKATQHTHQHTLRPLLHFASLNNITTGINFYQFTQNCSFQEDQWKDVCILNPILVIY